MKSAQRITQQLERFWHECEETLRERSLPLSSPLRAVLTFRLSLQHALTDEAPLELLADYGQRIYEQVTRMLSVFHDFPTGLLHVDWGGGVADFFSRGPPLEKTPACSLHFQIPRYAAPSLPAPIILQGHAGGEGAGSGKRDNSVLCSYDRRNNT